MADSPFKAAFDNAFRNFRGMNQFRIFAHGEDFDPDAYLASTQLQFDLVWRKGENGNDHPKSNGIAKVLGDGHQVLFFDQEVIAIEYLSANSDALKVLAQYPGVTTFKLGLHYNLVLGPTTRGFCMGPSAELMWHALDIGIDVNFYVELDRSQS